VVLAAKAGLLDHISPGKLQFEYIAKQQLFKSDIWWSILTGQLWSGPLAFNFILPVFPTLW